MSGYASWNTGGMDAALSPHGHGIHMQPALWNQTCYTPLSSIWAISPFGPRYGDGAEDAEHSVAKATAGLLNHGPRQGESFSVRPIG